MPRTSLTGQVNMLKNCKLFRTMAKNQLVARKPFLDKLSPAQLRKLYTSGKDPVLNELFDIYKGLDGFFTDIREGE